MGSHRVRHDWSDLAAAAADWIIENFPKKRIPKKIYFCLINYAKPFVWITTKCGKFLKRWEYQTTLPASCETCMQVKNRPWNNGPVPNWERSPSRLYIVTLLVLLICRVVHHEKCQARWITSWNQDCQEKYQQPQTCRWHHAYGRKQRGTKQSLMKVKEKREKVGLKLNIQKTKIMVSGPITSWQIDGETMETVTDYFLGLQNHFRW